jgi:glyoxylase-like metal-dependent hydrolase (beta-lactamase superfamily II)
VTFLLAFCPYTYGQQESGAASGPKSSKLSILPVQGDVYLIAGAGGNITVQVSRDAVVVVNTGLAGMTPEVMAAIRSISTKPILYVVNTSADPDLTGGNQAISRMGLAITGRIVSGAAILEDAGSSALILAHENVLNKLSAPVGGTRATPSGAWPTDTFLAGTEMLNGEAIQVFHEPAAHTDGDSIVWFRKSDVISAGRLFSAVSYPIIDLESHGSINGFIAGLNHILDIAVPGFAEEGGTYIVPNEGRIGDEADVVDYRDMVVIIRDRIQDMIKRKMTLAQVKSARPTVDFDPRYGAAAGPASTDAFVEAVYKDLSKAKQ